MSRGLRFRLKRAARQTREQHEHIHEILRDFESAVTERDRERLGEVYGLYRSALAAHFQLEEEVFFPALHGLHPEHGPELEELAAQHLSMASALEDLSLRVGTEAVEVFAAELRALVSELGHHEQREERLVRQLMRRPDAEDQGGPVPAPSRSGIESSS